MHHAIIRICLLGFAGDVDGDGGRQQYDQPLYDGSPMTEADSILLVHYSWPGTVYQMWP